MLGYAQKFVLLPRLGPSFGQLPPVVPVGPEMVGSPGPGSPRSLRVKLSVATGLVEDKSGAAETTVGPVVADATGAGATARFGASCSPCSSSGNGSLSSPGGAVGALPGRTSVRTGRSWRTGSSNSVSPLSTVLSSDCRAWSNPGSTAPEMRCTGINTGCTPRSARSTGTSTPSGSPGLDVGRTGSSAPAPRPTHSTTSLSTVDSSGWGGNGSTLPAWDVPPASSQAADVPATVAAATTRARVSSHRVRAPPDLRSSSDISSSASWRWARAILLHPAPQSNVVAYQHRCRTVGPIADGTLSTHDPLSAYSESQDHYIGLPSGGSGLR